MAPKNVKYIFCISTGRCGTDYLSKLLTTLTDCNSFHEQKPRLHKREMREYLKGNKVPVQNLISQKIEQINSSKDVLYSDTTHVFIKSFGWEIPKHIPQDEIGVIILKRDIDKVVESTHRTQSGPFNDLGRDWVIYPHKNTILRPPMSILKYKTLRFILKIIWQIEKNPGYKRYPIYFEKKSKELIKWYYNETYALGEKYQKDFPKIKYIDVQLEELNTFEGFEGIVSKFQLTSFYSRERLESLIGKPSNLK